MRKTDVGQPPLSLKIPGSSETKETRSSNRPSSMKRVANTVMSLFSSKQGSEKGGNKLPPSLGNKKIVARHSNNEMPEDVSGGLFGSFKKTLSGKKGSVKSGGT